MEDSQQLVSDIWQLELTNGYKMHHAAYMAIGGYMFYRAYKYTHWIVKNNEVQQMARDTLERRNS